MPWDKTQKPEARYKVIIHPSYEWDEDMKKLNLSYRELEVFALMMDNHEYKGIAQILEIEYQSVKNLSSSFFKKLKVKNLGQAMIVLLLGNVIEIEVPGMFKWDKERWIQSTRDFLKPTSPTMSEKEKEQMKKFFVEHEMYGKLYEDRRRELRNEKNDE